MGPRNNAGDDVGLRVGMWRLQAHHELGTDLVSVGDLLTKVVTGWTGEVGEVRGGLLTLSKYFSIFLILGKHKAAAISVDRLPLYLPDFVSSKQGACDVPNNVRLENI